MSRFFNSRLQDLKEYVPGEQPGNMKYIKLNTNESPFPPSRAVTDIINTKELSKLRLYPDPDCTALREVIAKQYGVGADEVVCGNGSDEILSFIFLAFCGENGVAFADHTYGFYKVYAALYGVKAEIIPLKTDFTLCHEDYFHAGKTIFIANPNAPTGLAKSRDEIEEVIKSNRDNVVVIDEAYVDFGAESCVPLVKKYNNLIVVQTCSKSRSLAGGRLGFAVACPCLINDINKIRYSINPYNINRLTQLAAKAAFEDTGYFERCCDLIKKSRRFTINELASRGFSVTDSKANFVFASCPSVNAAVLYEELKKRGVLVRHFNVPGIENHLRITVGTHGDMKALLCSIDSITAKGEYL